MKNILKISLENVKEKQIFVKYLITIYLLWNSLNTK